MRKYPNVFIDTETDRKYGRSFIKGVARYARHFGPWTFYRDRPFYARRRSLDRPDWDSFDGAIMRESPLIEEIMKREIPLILIPYTYECPGSIPQTHGEYKASAIMAAEHLLEKGLTRFGFCGYDDLPMSDIRKSAFTDYLKANGYETAIFSCVADIDYGGWEEEKKRLKRWLVTLSPPVGIMTCSDDRSRQLVEACRELDIRIPDEVAIIGVDNDELICMLSDPQLSSVDLNSEAAGYDTAALLSQMMKGETPDKMEIKARATGVITRQSTDILAVDDHELSQALSFIKQNSGKIIDVEDVVDATAISRRMLERRFRSVLKKSIYDEIAISRARRIAKILKETDYPISQIALDLGYSGEDHIARFFKSKMGMTPRSYRQSSRIILDSI